MEQASGYSHGSLLFSGLLFLAFSFIILLPAPARGAHPIELDHFFGFNSMCRADRWAPLTLVLKNPGPAIRAELSVRVKQGNEFNRDIVQTSYSQAANLPSGAKKLFYFDILILSGLHPVEIALEEEGKVIFSTSFSLRGRVTQKNLVLIPGDGAFAPPLPDQFQTVISRAETLPRDWVGYDGVFQVILVPSLVTRLTPKQVIALDTWVKNGGYLTVSGSMNYGVFSDSRIKSLLNISVSGVETRSSLPSLERFCNTPFNPGKDFWVNRIDPVEKGQGSLLVSRDQVPLIVKRNQGRGMVLFMGFDPAHPAFGQWQGQKVFWRKLADLQPGQSAEPAVELADNPADGPMPLDEDMILELMSRNFSDPFPNIVLVALGLVLYGVLVTRVLPLKPPVGFKRGLHLAGLMVLILVFSGAGFLVFRERTEVRANVSFLRVNQNSPRLVHETYGGVFSPEAGIKKISYGKTNSFVRALYPDFLPRETWLEADIKAAEGSLTLAMDRFTRFFYKTRTYRDSGFRYTAEKDDGIVLTIDNFTSTPIVNGVIYYKQHFFSIGTLAADRRTLFRIKASGNPGVVLSGGQVERLLLKGRENRPDVQLARELVLALTDGLTGKNQVDPTPEEEGSMLLCGWVGNPAGTTGQAEPRLILWKMKI